MTTEPFEPNVTLGEERIPAADPGRGAPEPEEGFGPTPEGADELSRRNRDRTPDEPDIDEP